MKSIDDLENFWKRFCENPAKTAAYTIALSGISIFSVMALGYVNGYFSEMGKQNQAHALANTGTAAAAVNPLPANNPVPAAATALSAPVPSAKTEPVRPALADLQKFRAMADEIPYHDKRSVQLGRVVDLAIKDGELEYASEIAEDISYDYLKSDALAKIADAYIRKGDLNTASSIAQKISTPAVKNKTLSKILSLR